MGCSSSVQAAPPEASAPASPAPAPASAAPTAAPAAAAPAAAAPAAAAENAAADSTPKSLAVTGPPASGKGDVCRLLAKTFGFQQISTVNTYKLALDKGYTEEDSLFEDVQKAKTAVENKESIPDEVMSKLLGGRIREEDCVKKGYLIDGYPRNRTQSSLCAMAGVKPTALIYVDMKDDQIIEKLCGRRFDPQTQSFYHVKGIGYPTLPEDAEIKARLVTRSDDNEERVKEVIERYKIPTEDLLEAWKDIVIRVDGSKDAESIVAEIKEKLDAL